MAQTLEDIISSALGDILELLGVPMEDLLADKILMPIIKSKLPDLGKSDIAYDAVLLSNASAYGDYIEKLQQNGSVVGKLAVKEPSEQAKAQIALGLTRAFISEKEYKPDEHGGMSWQDYTAMKAQGYGNNFLANMWYNTADPAGYGQMAKNLGELFTSVVGKDLAYGDRSRLGYSREFVNKLFQGENGDFEYNRRDYGGMGAPGAAYLAKELSKSMDVLEGVSANDANSLGTAAKRFSDRIKEYAKALSPLKDIFGQDIPKMISDIEAITGMSIGTIDTRQLRQISEKMVSRMASGQYTATDVANNVTDTYAAIQALGIKSPSRQRALQQTMQELDVATRGLEFNFLTKQEQEEYITGTVIGGANSEGADAINKAYAIWKEKPENKKKTMDDFWRELGGPDGKGYLNPVATALQLAGVETQTQLDAGMYLRGYAEANDADLGSRAAINRNIQVARENAIDWLVTKPEFRKAMLIGAAPGTVINDEKARQIVNDTLAFVRSDINLVNMSDAERKAVLDSKVEDAIKNTNGKIRYTDEYGTEQELDVTDVDTEQINRTITGLRTVEVQTNLLNGIKYEQATGEQANFDARAQRIRGAIEAVVGDAPSSAGDFLTEYISGVERELTDAEIQNKRNEIKSMTTERQAQESIVKTLKEEQAVSQNALDVAKKQYLEKIVSVFSNGSVDEARTEYVKANKRVEEISKQLESPDLDKPHRVQYERQLKEAKQEEQEAYKTLIAAESTTSNKEVNRALSEYTVAGRRVEEISKQLESKDLSEAERRALTTKLVVARKEEQEAFYILEGEAAAASAKLPSATRDKAELTKLQSEVDQADTSYQTTTAKLNTTERNVATYEKTITELEKVVEDYDSGKKTTVTLEGDDALFSQFSRSSAAAIAALQEGDRQEFDAVSAAFYERAQDEVGRREALLPVTTEDRLGKQKTIRAQEISTAHQAIMAVMTDADIGTNRVVLDAKNRLIEAQKAAMADGGSAHSEYVKYEEAIKSYETAPESEKSETYEKLVQAREELFTQLRKDSVYSSEAKRFTSVVDMATQSNGDALDLFMNSKGSFATAAATDIVQTIKGDADAELLSLYGADDKVKERYIKAKSEGSDTSAIIKEAGSGLYEKLSRYIETNDGDLSKLEKTSKEYKLAEKLGYSFESTAKTMNMERYTENKNRIEELKSRDSKLELLKNVIETGGDLTSSKFTKEQVEELKTMGYLVGEPGSKDNSGKAERNLSTALTDIMTINMDQSHSVTSVQRALFTAGVERIANLAGYTSEQKTVASNALLQYRDWAKKNDAVLNASSFREWASSEGKDIMSKASEMRDVITDQFNKAMQGAGLGSATGTDTLGLMNEALTWLSGMSAALGAISENTKNIATNTQPVVGNVKAAPGEKPLREPAAGETITE